mgnify:CR=1 FL=1
MQTLRTASKLPRQLLIDELLMSPERIRPVGKRPFWSKSCTISSNCDYLDTYAAASGMYRADGRMFEVQRGNPAGLHITFEFASPMLFRSSSIFANSACHDWQIQCGASPDGPWRTVGKATVSTGSYGVPRSVNLHAVRCAYKCWRYAIISADPHVVKPRASYSGVQWFV